MPCSSPLLGFALATTYFVFMPRCNPAKVDLRRDNKSSYFISGPDAQKSIRAVSLRVGLA